MKSRKKEVWKKERNGTNQKRRSYRKEGQRELIKTISSKRERQPESLSGDWQPSAVYRFHFPTIVMCWFHSATVYFPIRKYRTKILFDQLAVLVLPRSRNPCKFSDYQSLPYASPHFILEVGIISETIHVCLVMFSNSTRIISLNSVKFCNQNTSCFLWGTNQIFQHASDQFFSLRLIWFF
jgi:hypothetical protein